MKKVFIIVMILCIVRGLTFYCEEEQKTDTIKFLENLRQIIKKIFNSGHFARRKRANIKTRKIKVRKQLMKKLSVPRILSPRHYIINPTKQEVPSVREGKKKSENSVKDTTGKPIPNTTSLSITNAIQKYFVSKPFRFFAIPAIPKKTVENLQVDRVGKEDKEEMLDLYIDDIWRWYLSIASEVKRFWLFFKKYFVDNPGRFEYAFSSMGDKEIFLAKFLESIDNEEKFSFSEPTIFFAPLAGSEKSYFGSTIGEILKNSLNLPSKKFMKMFIEKHSLSFIISFLDAYFIAYKLQRNHNIDSDLRQCFQRRVLKSCHMVKEFFITNPKFISNYFELMNKIFLLKMAPIVGQMCRICLCEDLGIKCQGLPIVGENKNDALLSLLNNYLGFVGATYIQPYITQIQNFVKYKDKALLTNCQSVEDKLREIVYPYIDGFRNVNLQSEWNKVSKITDVEEWQKMAQRFSEYFNDLKKTINQTTKEIINKLNEFTSNNLNGVKEYSDFACILQTLWEFFDAIGMNNNILNLPYELFVGRYKEKIHEAIDRFFVNDLVKVKDLNELIALYTKHRFVFTAMKNIFSDFLENFSKNNPHLKGKIISLKTLNKYVEIYMNVPQLTQISQLKRMMVSSIDELVRNEAIFKLDYLLYQIYQIFLIRKCMETGLTMEEFIHEDEKVTNFIKCLYKEDDITTCSDNIKVLSRVMGLRKIERSKLDEFVQESEKFANKWKGKKIKEIDIARDCCDVDKCGKPTVQFCEIFGDKNFAECCAASGLSVCDANHITFCLRDELRPLYQEAGYTKKIDCYPSLQSPSDKCYNLCNTTTTVAGSIFIKDDSTLGEIDLMHYIAKNSSKFCANRDKFFEGMVTRFDESLEIDCEKCMCNGIPYSICELNLTINVEARKKEEEFLIKRGVLSYIKEYLMTKLKPGSQVLWECEEEK